MLMLRTHSNRCHHNGFSMIEVLVTIVILAFGLLGLAGFQLHAQTAELESYQRAQALVLLNDMAQRITANLTNAQTYPSTATLGTGTASDDCSSYAVGSADLDRCEWSNALKGSATSTGTGAMVGARGCVTQVQAADATAGVCTPAIYEVDVAWQGMTTTTAPAIACGSGDYGDDRYRRVVSRLIVAGLTGCS